MSHFARNAVLVLVVGLVAVFPTHDCAAQTQRSDVLRVYWDAGFSEVVAHAEIGDTATAYIVLENPSLTGNLAECRFFFELGSLPPSEFTSPVGTITGGPHHFFQVLAEPGIPLVDQLLIAVVRVPLWVDTMLAADLSGNSYRSEGETNFRSLVSPYRSSYDSAWLNTGEPLGAFDTPILDFGTHGYNVSTVVNATIFNVSDAPIFMVADFSEGCESFRLMNPEYLDVLAPYHSRYVEFEFSPSAVGEFSCAFSFGSGTDVLLQGNGRTPIYSLAAQDTLVLESTYVGGVSDSYILVENDGDYSVLLAPEISSSCPEFSTSVYGAVNEILPHGYEYILVDFEPVDLGVRECDLTIGGGLLSVHLKSAGREPITGHIVNPDTLDFGNADTQGLITRSIQITNTGELALETDVQIDGPVGVFQLSDPSGIGSVPPHQSRYIGIAFQPPTLGEFEAVVALGDGLPAVIAIGSGVEMLEVPYGTRPTLHFDPTNPGETDTKIIRVVNTSGASLVISPTTVSPLLHYLGPGGTIERGQSMDITAVYRPYEFGHFEFKIMLDSRNEFWVECVGTPHLDFESDQNRVGFFFDTEHTQIDLEITGESQVVVAYLAMLNPDDQSGVGGWECRVQPSAGAALVSSNLAGNFINAGQDNDFAVGLGLVPLPFGNTVQLGAFEFVLWDMTQDEFRLDLMPTTHSSIPGLMSWVPWDDLTKLTPMLPFTGQPTVAWIRPNMTVGTEVPTPHLDQQKGGVDLSWPNSTEAGAGFHVYRRHDAELPERLTIAPVSSTAQTVSFHDEPAGFASGAMLYYSYRLVVDGQEIGQSPEVAFEIKNNLPQITRLLPNVPNPFNPQTTIRFDLAKPSDVVVNIYDVTGRLVRQLENASLAAGPFELTWAGRDDHGRSVPSGAYYVRLVAGNVIDRRKIMLLK